MQEILERLIRIESALETLIEQRTIQEWYDTATVAKLLGRSHYRVREWCREGRVRAEKRPCGRGNPKD